MIQKSIVYELKMEYNVTNSLDKRYNTILKKKKKWKSILLVHSECGYSHL